MSIITRMVTYCIGNIAAKRRAFRAQSSDSAVCADNDEVLATFTLGGKLYVVTGTVPFSNTRLGQFIAYSRALKSHLPLKLDTIKEMLKSAGIKKNVCAKMGTLDVIDYRAASLAAKLDITTKTVYVNFDGLRFTRRNSKKIARYLRIWSKTYSVFVSVSDSRFIPRKAHVLNYTQNGVEEKRRKVSCRPTTRSSVRRRLRRAGMEMNLPQVKSIVVCKY